MRSYYIPLDEKDVKPWSDQFSYHTIFSFLQLVSWINVVVDLAGLHTYLVRMKPRTTFAVRMKIIKSISHPGNVKQWK